MRERWQAWIRPRMLRKGHRRERILRWETERFERSAGIESGGWLWLSEGTIPDGDITEGNPFGTAPVRVTQWWLRALPRRLGDFTFIDMGSGRGRVMFGVASQGFRRIVGVEFVEELHRDSLANVERFRARNHNNSDIFPVLGDAASYEFPLDPLVVHFCNPFSESIMEPVIANLSASHQQRPRPIFALYHQSWIEPEERQTRNVDLLADAPLFVRHTLLHKDRLTDRLLLGSYRTDLFESPEARALS